MHHFTSDDWTDADTKAVKIRLAKMDDQALQRFIEAAEIHEFSGGKPRQATSEVLSDTTRPR
jgi:hypothetical protein